MSAKAARIFSVPLLIVIAVLFPSAESFADRLNVKNDSEPELDHCRTDQYDAEVDVSQIIDGDTLRLKDGRLVRFIGINTPEIDHKGSRSESFALLAREILSQQIGPKKRVRLVFGSEAKDRYGRLLAHVFSLDGSNIQATILTRGVAYWIVVPPNLRFKNCYQQAEKIAQQKKIKVWSDIEFSPLAVSAQTQFKRGFQIIAGRVNRYSRDRNGVSLYLSDKLVIRVATRFLHYFSDAELHSYKINRLHIKGWLYPRQGLWQMSLKHPDSVQILRR